MWQQEANNNVSEIQVTLLPLTEQVVHIAALIAYTNIFFVYVAAETGGTGVTV